MSVDRVVTQVADNIGCSRTAMAYRCDQIDAQGLVGTVEGLSRTVAPKDELHRPHRDSMPSAFEGRSDGVFGRKIRSQGEDPVAECWKQNMESRSEVKS